MDCPTVPYIQKYGHADQEKVVTGAPSRASITVTQTLKKSAFILAASDGNRSPRGCTCNDLFLISVTVLLNVWNGRAVHQYSTQ